MNATNFNEVIEDMIDKCKNTLCQKAEEYATHDRLHNFKVAAGIQGITNSAALAGMMAKHTVSIYDMATSNEPEHENSKRNGGEGLRMDFDKANHYEFGDTIKWFNKPVGTKDNHLIMEFEVL